MRSFGYSQLKDRKWNSEMLSLVAAVYEEAGKMEIYLSRNPQGLGKMVETARILSTGPSNAIEGIVTTDTRLKQLVGKKTTPRNRNEEEIAGYRDALRIIHESFDAIPITKNYILQLHKILYSHMNNPLAGQTKNVQNTSVQNILMEEWRFCLLLLNRMKLRKHLRDSVPNTTAS